MESTVISKINFMVQEVMGIFSDDKEEIFTTPGAYMQSLQRTRSQECPIADASEGVVFDAQNLAADKISFGFLQITTIEISLTFKLEVEWSKFDFSDPSQLFFGLMNLLKPFLS